MITKNNLKNLDFSLIFVVFSLFTFGLVMILSATNALELNNGIPREIKIQAIAFLIGIFMVILMVLIDYNTFGEIYKAIYIASILFLLLVYVPGIGVIKNGARSWIDIGIIYIQTSEIAKIGFILSFSKFLENRMNEFNSISDLILPVLFVLPFVFFLILQPDLGSALVFVFIAIGMIFVAGLSYKIILGGSVLSAISFPIIYRFLEPHQKIRIDAFLNPSDPSLPGNYHVMQSKITIGSGMVYGRGIFKGLYHKYNYLPVQETDFIYAVIGEETGFIGGILVIFFYFIMLLRMINVSKKSKDLYGTLVATGITFMFAFQIFENIGMTLGIMPVTGITLPFLSYGGSSIITSMISIGIILNIYMRRKRIDYDV
ncbi:rod shape-determining protein RodA [Helicovermis profundi]|uniref:Rod shape-determining protein RodA n=1 Tax=Helicovermis profundi TaxID=3065157 RepID=A0AAU9ED35_9FIRM|nr:rod shape-determining protein RodA [Clostridia bacterium S502]